eukprot:COSAG05_NODE_895_length_6700_cov_14.354189_8_plen_251_part_00
MHFLRLTRLAEHATRQARLGSSPVSGSPMELGRFKSGDSASYGARSTDAAAAAAADHHQAHNSPRQGAGSGSTTARQSPQKPSSSGVGGGGTVASIDPHMRSRLQSAAFDTSAMTSTAPAESTVQLLVDLTEASERQCVTALSLAKNDVEYAIRLLHMSPQVRYHCVPLALAGTLPILALPRVYLWMSLITVSLQVNGPTGGSGGGFRALLQQQGIGGIKLASGGGGGGNGGGGAFSPRGSPRHRRLQNR